MKNLFIKRSNEKISKLSLWLNSAIAFLILFFALYIPFSQLNYEYNWESVYNYKSVFFKGFISTLIISALALILSLIIGILLAFAKKSKVILLSICSNWFIEIIRGTPLLVQILLFYYVILPVFPISSSFDDRIFSGVVVLSIFSGAYLSEIIRGGIEAVSKTNLEAAKVLGLTKLQTQIYVVLPQVVKMVLPSIAGQLVSLIKDSSLLSIIAVKELTMAANEMNAATYSTIEAYLPLLVGYMIITLPISMFSKFLEKRFIYES